MNELSAIANFGQYDLRVNPNNEHELFLPDARAAGNLLFREKLPTAQGTSFPRPNQFHAHGYVNLEGRTFRRAGRHHRRQPPDA